MEDFAIVPLSTTEALNPHSVGAKASRLATILQAGFPVPPGFVVGVKAFEHLHPELIQEWTLKGDPVSSCLSSSMTSRIIQKARELATPVLAVRSSGVDEDGHNHSMAGQFATYLNTLPEQVGERVCRCWSSQFNAAPRAYRHKFAAATGVSRMGVIVQSQVDAKWAGVLFTVDPMTRSADHFVVEWVEGLGDRLVSGELDPYRALMRREHTEPPKNLPLPLSSALKQLWKWAHEAERLFLQPMDIEWAANEQGVYILQVRPVTGLIKHDTVVWTNVNIAENFPHPLAPLTWSFVERFYSAYMRTILRSFGWSDRSLSRNASIINHLTGLQAGRIYYNLNNWYAVIGCFPFSRWLIRFLNHYIGQKVPFEFSFQSNTNSDTTIWQRLRIHLPFVPRMLKRILQNKRRMDNFEIFFFKTLRSWRQTPYDHLSGAELLKRTDSLLHFVDKDWAPPAMADIMVMILPGLLDVLTEHWLKMDAERVATQLFKGIDLISIQPSVLIWELSRAIDSDPKLLALLKTRDYERLEETLPPSLRERLDYFMERFGGRCYHDCMLVAPTFVERHDLFWDLVLRYSLSQIASPVQKLSAHRYKRRSVTDDLLQRLPPVRRLIYRWIVDQAQQAVRLRERGRLLQSLLFGEMRLLSLALGHKLKTQGILSNEEEIFYLHMDELDHLVNSDSLNHQQLADLIASRKQSLEINEAIDPPSFFFLERDAEARFDTQTNAYHEDSKSGSLSGTAVSRGRLTARARVILDPLQGDQLQSGEILVTRTTDPGWTPLFSIAGGLILERGGLLSHGAIVAREFGIPAVAGVENATRLISDGMQVELDGYDGLVTLVPIQEKN
jgi:pyruvate,water dikinase